jgi:hypothetical protein
MSRHLYIPEQNERMSSSLFFVFLRSSLRGTSDVEMVFVAKDKDEPKIKTRTKIHIDNERFNRMLRISPRLLKIT